MKENFVSDARHADSRSVGEDAPFIDLLNMEKQAYWNFDEIDKDENRYLTSMELSDFAEKPSTVGQDKLIAESLGEGFEIIQGLNDDEWFQDDDGITFGDIHRLHEILDLESKRLAEVTRAQKIFPDVDFSALEFDLNSLQVKSAEDFAEHLQKIIDQPREAQADVLDLGEDRTEISAIDRHEKNRLTLNSSGELSEEVIYSSIREGTRITTNLVNGDRDSKTVFESGDVKASYESKYGYEIIFAEGKSDYVETHVDKMRDRVTGW